jgi:small multidrug resistance family-3 protein
MRTFWFVLAATTFEAFGDAVIRRALNHPAPWTRAGLFALGGSLLMAYGTSLNLAPVEFATVTGLYVAMLFVMFQVVNALLFQEVPSPAVLIGGGLIVSGGLVVFLGR